MAWTYGTATNYLDVQGALVTFCNGDHVSAIALVSGGTGYEVDDILTVAGGTVLGLHAAQIRVTAETGNVITAAVIEKSGSYSADPDLTANAVTGGSGSGASFDLTMDDTGWTALETGPPEAYLRGDGDGTQEIYVGVRTFTDGSAVGWEVAGFTGYNVALDWEDQAGYSNKATFVPMADQETRYWFNVTPRRILCIFEIGGTYTNCYMGFLNPDATAGEWPYPLYISGCCTKSSKTFNTSGDFMSGLTDPIFDDTGSEEGPACMRAPDGQWYVVQNSGGSGSSRSARNTFIVHPCGLIANTTNMGINDFVERSGYNAQALWIPTSVGGTPQGQLLRTPDTGGDKYPLFRCVVVSSSPSENIWGEIDDVFWISVAATGADGPTDEDIIDEDGELFYVFRNCNRNDVFSYLAIRKGV